jgi:hypothetical protein
MDTHTHRQEEEIVVVVVVVVGGRKAILGHFPAHHSYWPRIGSISFLLPMGLDDQLSYNLPT